DFALGERLPSVRDRLDQHLARGPSHRIEREPPRDVSRVDMLDTMALTVVPEALHGPHWQASLDESVESIELLVELATERIHPEREVAVCVVRFVCRQF